MLIEIEQYGKVVRSSGATYPIFLRAMLWDKLCALAFCLRQAGFAREKKISSRRFHGKIPQIKKNKSAGFFCLDQREKKRMNVIPLNSICNHYLLFYFAPLELWARFL